jgi:NitT/TauT family transport system ATP-binding protein
VAGTVDELHEVAAVAPEAAASGDRDGIALRAVSRILGGKTVLDGLDLAVPRHRRLGIVGRSGVGKSTLLGLVAGLDSPDSGTISVYGETAPERRLERCALMPQRDCLLPWRTALDNACLALENRGVPREQARTEALPFFARLGLAGAERLRPARLSGGMRQRVAFLRTLLSGKEVLLLDEPFGALDAITRAELQEWLAGVLAGDPRTVLLVTHDVEEALLLCDRVDVLAGGKVALSLDVDVPRAGAWREIVTGRAFVELREQALEAIG